MTRMYLSPTATIFVKISLIIAECFIGLYNLITYPIRKITIKKYCSLALLASVFYIVGTYFGLALNLEAFVLGAISLAASVVITRLLYKYLKNKVSPKVAYLINSPLGIPLNRFYNVT